MGKQFDNFFPAQAILIAERDVPRQLFSFALRRQGGKGDQAAFAGDSSLRAQISPNSTVSVSSASFGAIAASVRRSTGGVLIVILFAG